MRSTNNAMVIRSRRIIANLRNLITDENGREIYTPYADQIFQYLTGRQNLVSRVLGSVHPVQSAAELMRNPRTRKLAIILSEDDDNTLDVLYCMVVCLYRMNVMSQLPKKKVTKEVAKLFASYRKMVAKGLKRMRSSLGYGESEKDFAKEEMAPLYNYAKRRSRGSSFFVLDDDDDELFDDEDDEDEDLTDQVLRMRREKASTILDDSGLALSADEIGIDPEIEEPIRQAHKMPREVNYDFTGKATLDVIADRLEAILESNQLIINRLYGRKIESDDNDLPSGQFPLADPDEPLVEGLDRSNEAFENFIRQQETVKVNPVLEAKLNALSKADFKNMSVSDMISLYNSLTDELEGFVNTSDTRVFNNPTVVPQPVVEEDEEEEEPDYSDIDEGMQIMPDEADPKPAEEVKEEPKAPEVTDPEDSPFPTVADQFNSERS